MKQLVFKLILLLTLCGELAYAVPSDPIRTQWTNTNKFFGHVIELDLDFVPKSKKSWTLNDLKGRLKIASQNQKSGFTYKHLRLDKIEDVPLPAILPLYEKERFYVLLDKFTIEKEQMYQLVTGNDPPILKNIKELKKMFGQAPLEVWTFNCEDNREIIKGAEDIKLQINKLHHNFGYVPRCTKNNKLSCTFRVKNVGEKAIRVHPPLTSCSCVAAKSANSDLLKPAEYFDVEISTSLPGKDKNNIRYDIIEKFEDIENGQTYLLPFEIVGNFPAIEIYPVPTKFNFGKIPKGEIKEVFVRISETKQTRLNITDINTFNPSITAYIEGDFNDNRKNHIIRMKLNTKESPFGKFEDHVEILTDHTKYDAFNIPITYEIIQPVICAPSVLSWGRVKSGAISEKLLELTAINKKPFKIINIESPQNLKIIEIEINNSNKKVFRITKEFSQPGTWRDKLFFHVEQSNEKLIIETPLIALVKE